MNIDEYRAMVAQEAQEANNPPEGVVDDVQTDPNTTALLEQPVQTTTETSTIPTETVAETEAPSLPEAIDVGGVEVPIDELRQGYLRQSDYTKKTQELARIKQQTELANKYFEAIQTDPEFAEGIATRFDLPFMTKEEIQNQELKDAYHNLLLERDINALQQKYDDVNVQEVVKVAFEKRFENLEDAYIFSKAQKGATTTAPDINSIKEQIRQEVLRELQSNVDTSTIIGTGGTTSQVKSNIPELSAAELKVAQNMNMTATDYAKWKSMK